MQSPYLLLVDDDPDLGLALAVLSRRAGFRLTRQPDVESAWRSVQAERPDLVLLDVNLPGASGLDLLRRLRGNETFRPLPVALFCQSGLTADLAAGWSAGAGYFVAKDLMTLPGQWQARVSEILAHAAGQAAPAPLAWLLGAKALSTSWGEWLRQALTQPALRRVKVELAQAVLRRALIGVFGEPASGLGLVRERDRLALVLPRNATAQQVHGVFLSVADQLWCLFGAEAAAAFTQALRTIGPV